MLVRVASGSNRCQLGGRSKVEAARETVAPAFAARNANNAPVPIPSPKRLIG